MKTFKICPQQLTPDLCNNIDQVGKGRVYVTNTNETFPSITSLLSKTMDTEKKMILEGWMEYVGEEQAEKIKKDAANRGSNLHNLIEYYILGDDFQNKFNEADKKTQRLFKQIEKHLDKIDNVRLIEKPLYSSKLRVAGRVDCIGEYEGKLSIIDFKTSSKTKTSDNITDYYIQETFYAVCYAEHFNEKIEQLVTIIATDSSLRPYVYIKKPSEYIEKLLGKVKLFYKG